MDKGPKSAYSFLSGFGAFLESEIKFSKLLVQPSHHLVTCAHHKKLLILLNKLRLLWYIHTTDYVHLSVVSYIISCYCHVAQNVLYSSLCYSLKAVSHWTRCEKARWIADERCFNTERETNVCLLLIHACMLGGADQQCIFPQICISYMDLTLSAAQYIALN